MIHATEDDETEQASFIAKLDLQGIFDDLKTWEQKGNEEIQE